MHTVCTFHRLAVVHFGVCMLYNILTYIHTHTWHGVMNDVYILRQMWNNNEKRLHKKDTHAQSTNYLALANRVLGMCLCMQSHQHTHSQTHTNIYPSETVNCKHMNKPSRNSFITHYRKRRLNWSWTNNTSKILNSSITN